MSRPKFSLTKTNTNFINLPCSLFFHVPTVLWSKKPLEACEILSSKKKKKKEKKSYHLLLWQCMVLPLHVPGGFLSELPGSLSIYFSPYTLLRKYPTKWKKKKTLTNRSFIE